MIKSVSKCSYNIHISYFIRSRKVFFNVLWVLSSVVAQSGTQAISDKKCSEILNCHGEDNNYQWVDGLRHEGLVDRNGN